MKEKKFSVRLMGNQIDIVEKTAEMLHVSNSEAIRSFIEEDKIIIIKEFDKMIPVLVNLTMLLEKDEKINDCHTNLEEGVDEIWRLLNSVMANQKEG